MRQDSRENACDQDQHVHMWSLVVGAGVDELKIRRMKKCAESPGGHNFGEPVDHVVECNNCGLAIEELEHILGGEQ